MKIERTNIQMRKGILDYCILLILNTHKSYASDIIDILKKSQMTVVEGTIYPLLMRLKNQGFLAYEWQESTMGPPRKYYYITQQGENFLNELNNSWQEIENTINFLKTINQESNEKDS